MCIEKVLATPPLNGLILPGITRQSILDLAREWDEFLVEERAFTMSELIELNKNKQVSKKTGMHNSQFITAQFSSSTLNLLSTQIKRTCLQI